MVRVVSKLKVNGTDYELLIEPNCTLQRTPQQRLRLTGAKQMCDRGVCGSCTVIIDGPPTQAQGIPSIRRPNIGKGCLILDGVNRVATPFRSSSLVL